MRKLITILFVCLLPFISNAQVANAGSDHTIWLNEGNHTTVGESSSATSYLWTKIYDVQQPQAGYPTDPATIDNPTSASTGISNMIQGTWYYQLAATTGATTVKDTVVIRVDVEPPPDNYSLIRYLPFYDNTFDTAVNNRVDTTQFAADKNSVTLAQGSFFFNRARYNSMMIDSSRGKMYTTNEDGYYWPNSVSAPGPYGEYSRAEIHLGSFYYTDTTKTYIYEWKGYFPQSIKSNIPLTVGVPPNDVFSKVLTIMQWHGLDNNSGPFLFNFTHDYLSFQENGDSNNGADTTVNLMPTDDSYTLNKTHTYRVEMREGAKYSGQDAYIKVYLDGVLKYSRDTGQVGQTLQQDYIKFSGLYDYRNTLTSPDSATRGKKFSLVTEAFNIYAKNYPVVNAGNTINTTNSSVTLSGSVEKNPDKTVTYSWSKYSGSGSQTILNNTTLTPTITGLVNGTYVFSLTASQSDSQSNTAYITINKSDDAGNSLKLPGRYNVVN